MPFLVGVDVGATNTALLAVDDADAVVVERRLPGAYLPDVGEEAFAQLLAAVRDVLRDLPASDLRVVFGLPGHGDITDLTRRHVELLGRLYPDVRHRAYNDVYLALVGAHLGAPGIVALSGTGSMALGRNSAGHLDRLGGLGPILGDEGSAYAIALHALRVAALANDRRARATSLVDATLRHFGVGEVAEVTLQLMNHAQARARLASFAREVDACARDGDRA
ncbi:N-acetylglucosamine kinase, partial [Deinococcus pimensis]|uniref:N-acetylglucosamine kinase n=1 Tax=Deinococcus pimensis TaxID=309888 RepID=UPI000693D4A1